MIDVIGTTFTAGVFDGDVLITEPEPLPGWHVIATEKLTGCEDYLSPNNPPRVFAGATTHYYVFESEEQAKELLGWDGEQYRPQPVPVESQIVPALVNAVQEHLDATAQQRGYDGILSLCSYATSSVPQFAAEGQAGVTWRDACWTHCYATLAACRDGEMAIPTTDELVSALPLFVWP